MISVINTPTQRPPNVICDFGWYYGTSPARLPEYHYQIANNQYPPGMTTLGTNVTLPSSTVASSFTALSDLMASFPPEGYFVLNSGTAHITISYTGLGTLSGSSTSGVQGFTGCAGGSGSYNAGTAIYDQRFYVDSMPLNTIVTFDATDHLAFGLPTVVVPPNVTIINYQWDFGNGIIGYGPQASVTYGYNQPPSSIQATLTVTDSLGREYSCAHRLNLIALTPIYGTVIQEVQGPGPYNGTLNLNGNLVIKHGTSNFDTFNPNRGGKLNLAGNLTTVRSGP